MFDIYIYTKTGFVLEFYIAMKMYWNYTGDFLYVLEIMKNSYVSIKNSSKIFYFFITENGL